QDEQPRDVRNAVRCREVERRELFWNGAAILTQDLRRDGTRQEFPLKQAEIKIGDLCAIHRPLIERDFEAAPPFDEEPFFVTRRRGPSRARADDRPTAEAHRGTL